MFSFLFLLLICFRGLRCVFVRYYWDWGVGVYWTFHFFPFSIRQPFDSVVKSLFFTEILLIRSMNCILKYVSPSSLEVVYSSVSCIVLDLQTFWKCSSFYSISTYYFSCWAFACCFPFFSLHSDFSPVWVVDGWNGSFCWLFFSIFCSIGCTDTVLVFSFPSSAFSSFLWYVSYCSFFEIVSIFSLLRSVFCSSLCFLLLKGKGGWERTSNAAAASASVLPCFKALHWDLWTAFPFKVATKDTWQ